MRRRAGLLIADGKAGNQSPATATHPQGGTGVNVLAGQGPAGKHS